LLWRASWAEAWLRRLRSMPGRCAANWNRSRALYHPWSSWAELFRLNRNSHQGLL